MYRNQPDRLRSQLSEETWEHLQSIFDPEPE
jgi:hypothetical protein